MADAIAQDLIKMHLPKVAKRSKKTENKETIAAHSTSPQTNAARSTSPQGEKVAEVAKEVKVTEKGEKVTDAKEVEATDVAKEVEATEGEKKVVTTDVVGKGKTVEKMATFKGSNFEVIVQELAQKGRPPLIKLYEKKVVVDGKESKGRGKGGPRKEITTTSCGKFGVGKIWRMMCQLAKDFAEGRLQNHEEIKTKKSEYMQSIDEDDDDESTCAHCGGVDALDGNKYCLDCLDKYSWDQLDARLENEKKLEAEQAQLTPKSSSTDGSKAAGEAEAKPAPGTPVASANTFEPGEASAPGSPDNFGQMVSESGAGGDSLPEQCCDDVTVL